MSPALTGGFLTTAPTREVPKKECYLLRSCLVGARRTLLFMIEHEFLLVGRVRPIHNADTQCTVEGREVKGQ